MSTPQTYELGWLSYLSNILSPHWPKSAGQKIKTVAPPLRGHKVNDHIVFKCTICLVIRRDNKTCIDILGKGRTVENTDDRNQVDYSTSIIEAKFRYGVAPSCRKQHKPYMPPFNEETQTMRLSGAQTVRRAVILDNRAEMLVLKVKSQGQGQMPPKSIHFYRFTIAHYCYRLPSYLSALNADNSTVTKDALFLSSYYSTFHQN